MNPARDSFPDNIEALKAALIAERAEAARVTAELAVARAKASDDQALISHQRLQIEKLKRQLYGTRSERTSRLLDQVELQFEELRARQRKMRSPPRRRLPRPQRSQDLRASVPRASRFQSICCHVNASSCRDRQLALAAAALGCGSWARPSPRRWNRSRVNGK